MNRGAVITEMDMDKTKRRGREIAAFGVLLWFALGALALESEASHTEKEQQSRSRLRDYGVCPRKLRRLMEAGTGQ